ncbi:MAG: hypothetical protein Alpg2KO_22160 [Alphaproteobacteria bacterium]
MCDNVGATDICPSGLQDLFNSGAAMGGILKAGFSAEKTTHLGQITARRAMFAPQEAVRAPIR